MTEEMPVKRDISGQLLRGLFMLLFFIIGRFATLLVGIVAVFQFVCTLVLHKPRSNVQVFGWELGNYVAQIVGFLTYNTEEKPWPFSRWPRMGREA